MGIPPDVVGCDRLIGVLQLRDRRFWRLFGISERLLETFHFHPDVLELHASPPIAGPDCKLERRAPKYLVAVFSCSLDSNLISRVRVFLGDLARSGVQQSRGARDVRLLTADRSYRFINPADRIAHARKNPGTGTLRIPCGRAMDLAAHWWPHRRH